FAAARRVERIQALGAGIHAVSCDVSVEHDRVRLAETAFARTGRFDVLVNNAGVGGERQAVKESADDFAQVLAVNLVAPFHLSRLMAEGGGGSVINVASILGLVS